MHNNENAEPDLKIAEVVSYRGGKIFSLNHGRLTHLPAALFAAADRFRIIRSGLEVPKKQLPRDLRKIGCHPVDLDYHDRVEFEFKPASFPTELIPRLYTQTA